MNPSYSSIPKNSKKLMLFCTFSKYIYAPLGYFYDIPSNVQAHSLKNFNNIVNDKIKQLSPFKYYRIISNLFRELRRPVELSNKAKYSRYWNFNDIRISKLTSLMERECCYLLMVVSTKATLKLENRMAMEGTIMQMETYTKDIRKTV